MTTIATQIRARLGAIAAERSRLDDEERRLKKALEALEPTTPSADDIRIGDLIVGVKPEGARVGNEETLEQLIGRMPPMPPTMPVYPWQPHYPARPWDHSDPWQIPLGPFCGTVSAQADTGSVLASGHNID